MADQKAPSFPFYYRDWLHAVRRWSAEEKIEYLEMIFEQADSSNGSIPAEIFESECTTPRVQSKFEKDVNGYFNVRLRDILHKRKSYLESRRKNLMGDHKDSHKGTDMEKEKENRKGKGNMKTGNVKKKPEHPPLLFPFSDELFVNRWAAWKEYKAEQFNFRYKPRGEQAALKKMGDLSGGSSEVAVAIIEQSMANGWMGLFPLDHKPNQQGYEQQAGNYADQILKKHGAK